MRLLLVSSLVCILGLSGCKRFGYHSLAGPVTDAGHVTPSADAALHDAEVSTPDASIPVDANTPTPDAAAPTDASKPLDADTPTSDASPPSDASTPSDAAPPSDADTGGTDASMTPDAATDAGPSCVPSATRDYCLQIPALAQPPVLDGTLDCGPPLIDLPAMGWNSTLAMPSDNHARYAAAWRPDGLYVYVEVDDPLRLPALASDVNPWCGDGVELYVDADGKYIAAPDYDDPGAIQLLATAPARDSSTALAVDARYHTRSQFRIADWTATRHVSVPRATGYALEAFVAAADLDLSSWQLTTGNTVGLDIAINVSVTTEGQKVDCGSYLGQYYLRVSRLPCNTDGCRPYSNAAAFCTATLE